MLYGIFLVFQILAILCWILIIVSCITMLFIENRDTPFMLVIVAFILMIICGLITAAIDQFGHLGIFTTY